MANSSASRSSSCQILVPCRHELIVQELRQLRRAEHGVVAHQHRRLDLGIAVLHRVQVQHELLERARQPRERPLQHDEARARELRRRLEIHQAERLADLEMLLRREAVGKNRRLAVAAHLDIVVLVLAVGNVVERQVGDFGQRGLERGVRLALGRLHFGHGRLQPRHLGLEIFGRLRVLARHRRADLLRSGVAPLLGALQIEDRGAPALVEGDQRFGARRQAAPGEPFVERLGIVADGPDVVHESPEGQAPGAAPGRSAC